MQTPSSTAYQHRPLSKILAPLPDVAGEPTPTPKGADGTPKKIEPDQVPEKYKDKSLAQVIDMHQNAEKELGRTRNEIGQYRGLVQDLSQLRRSPEQEPEKLEEIDVSGDELLESPVETIRRVVKQDLAAFAAKADERDLSTTVAVENDRLLRDHPDLNTVVGSEDFQEFAARTPGRQQDFNTAAQGEGLDQVRAARRLLEDYEDFNQAIAGKSQQTPVDKARKVATESGTGAAPPPAGNTDQIYEADVIKLIASDVAKYRSPSYQAELVKAIREGRFVKN